MNDQDIIALYFDRNEQAIAETDKSYGKACMQVSMNILQNRPDAEECVNDTYLKTWNAIPPTRPNSLCAFVCRIARNLSLSRLRDLRRQKRNQELTLSLDELEACEISTIHAFCTKVLRSEFQAVGIDPMFRICEENAKHQTL